MSITQDEVLLGRLKTTLARLWEEGSPVVGDGPEHYERIALLAVRRWRSFARRHDPGSLSFERRVEDLAKGLRDSLEPSRSLVGRLMDDYRYAARTLADILNEQ
jgi:hypothetical protein